MKPLKIGSHVGMSGKEMLLGSVKEAVSYGANTFMFYTGAPQNTRRKELSELNIEPAWEYMKEHGIDEIVVHAPYIINLGNSVKPETFELAVEFLNKEIQRTVACKSHTLILHPGAHVGAGAEAGTKQIIKGLNEVLTAGTDCCICLLYTSPQHKFPVQSHILSCDRFSHPFPAHPSHRSDLNVRGLHIVLRPPGKTLSGQGRSDTHPHPDSIPILVQKMFS